VEVSGADHMARGHLFELVVLVFLASGIQGHMDVARLVMDLLYEPSMEEFNRAECKKVLDVPRSVRCLAHSSVNNLLAGGDGQDRTIKLWNIKSQSRLGELKGHTDWIQSIAFSSDGMRLVSGSEDCSVKFWHVDTMELLGTMTSHVDGVYCVAFTPNDQNALSTSWDRTIILSEVEKFQALRIFYRGGHRSPISALAVAPNGLDFCTGSLDFTLRVWNVEQEDASSSLTLNGHSLAVRSVQYSQDSLLIISGSEDKTCKLWNAKSGELLRSFEGHEHWILGVCFLAPNLFASCSLDMTARVWNSQGDFIVKRHTSPFYAIIFTKSGRILLGDRGGSVTAWGI